jgi:hypothetical protein
LKNNDKWKKSWSDSKRAMYNIPSLVMISPLQSPLSLECEEGKRFIVGIGVTFQFAKYIQESLWLVLECLRKGIFSKRLGMLIRKDVITK